ANRDGRVAAYIGDLKVGCDDTGGRGACAGYGISALIEERRDINVVLAGDCCKIPHDHVTNALALEIFDRRREVPGFKSVAAGLVCELLVLPRTDLFVE